ncbi:lysozyme inhibitor LprI family protein [Paraclostridium sordellii]|uniref:lysozyme inhibitor LprI family protein n=1 Tax=Paraclostridium sordellii TaxID=1505 RepID=UPI0005E7583E|nr:lysozyme inhibitor LprI family protein [Paeniclostridium sordellii]CEQ14271.1 putative lipoprotein [[Clostridium] sordellii] [Paeniclostridium sordellii]CEQ28794.1 putative lipoprotein [[Clostridium] sordellii] [Paeniclostridium sordellii]
MGIIGVLAMIMAGVMFYYFNPKYLCQSLEARTRRYIKYFVISLAIIGCFIFLIGWVMIMLGKVAILAILLIGIVIIFKTFKNGSNKTKIVVSTVFIIIIGFIFVKDINKENKNVAKQTQVKEYSESSNGEQSLLEKDNKYEDKGENEVESSKQAQNIQNKKYEYIQKLDSIKNEVNGIVYDGSMEEMKEQSSKGLKKWDDALNEIYGVLKLQLSSGEMDSLKEEQLQWISNRDEIAEKEANEFKGGTMEGLQYTESLARITKDRCYELVNTYMK